jgi:PAS domain S-box-containing protein
MSQSARKESAEFWAEAAARGAAAREEAVHLCEQSRELLESLDGLSAQDFRARSIRRAAVNLMEDAIAARTAVDREVADRERAEQDLAEEFAATELLARLGGRLIREGDRSALYVEILQAAIELLRAHGGSLQTVDPKKNQLQLLAWKEFQPGPAALWETITVETAAIEAEERLIVSDVQACEFLTGTPSLEHYNRCGIRAVQATPLVSRSGHFVGVISTYWREVYSPNERKLRFLNLLARQAADALERKQNEDTLRERERELETVVNQTPFLLTRCGRDLRYRFVSRACAAMLGRAPEEIIGKSIAEIMGEATFKIILPHIKKVLRGEVVEYEAEIAYKGAGVRCVRVVYTPEMDGSGNVSGWVASIADITERKHAEEALRAAKEAAELANRAKDRFLAVLSHELRTPLTPVLMTVAALEHDPALSAEVREDMTMVKRNIELEVKLIDDLLDLNRIGSGKLRLEIETVDLNETVRRVCGICQSEAARLGVRIETALAEGACSVAADPARLQQVLWNLLKNAVKFTPEGGTVTVTTAVGEDGGCQVRVRDDGMGIAPEVLPRIFEAFEQGHDKITRQFGGMGLGLAITKALVELHGGTIRAESEGIGKGTTFEIIWPAQNADVTSPESAPSESGCARQLRLLLVEDHYDTAQALRRQLRAAGYTVTVASDVSEALATADRESFDVLVSDIGLPDGDGYQVMGHVRETRSIPGIARSGDGMDDDVRRSREAGFTEHLVKPIQVPQLVAAIQRVTENRG